MNPWDDTAPAPILAGGLGTEVTRWSTCEGARECSEIVDRYGGSMELVPQVQEMPCGCGKHEVRITRRRAADREPIHWLGLHWDVDCAYRKAMQLLRKALNEAEDQADEDDA